MPRRSPTGLTFWPIRPPSRRSRTTMVRWLNGFITRPVRPRALGPPALHHQTLADCRFGDDEPVHVQLVIVLRVRDRRLQALAHVTGDAAARVGERDERLVHRASAYGRADQAELLRADPEVPDLGLGFGLTQPPGTCQLAPWSAPPRSLVAGMAVEDPRRRKLAELVADHVLVDQHRQKLAPVVDAKGEAHELRQDRGPPRPRCG